MKVIVDALLNSFNGIYNVFIVTALVWLMFCIIGISMMRDKM
jgi:hypothetical protein